MSNVFFWLAMLIYSLLPVAYRAGEPIFLTALIFSVGIVFFKTDNVDEVISRLFFWSFSFFGVAFGGLKLFDISLLVGVVSYLLVKKSIRLTQALIIFFPFFAFITITSMLRNDNVFVQGTGGSPMLELLRYGFAAIALFLFFQMRPTYKSMISWLDKISIAIIIQAVIMFFIPGLSSIETGFLQVDLFTIDSLNPNSEARISAFFSDPNKMMAFFSVLLLVRFAYTALMSATSDMNYDKRTFIYIIGVLLSLSRTGVIVAVLYTFLFILNKIISSRVVTNMIFWFALILGAFSFLIMKDTIIKNINALFTSVLTIFGRARTANIDSNVTTDTRVLIWKQASQYIAQRPIIGNGLLSESRLLPIPTHNTFVQQLLDNGTVGMLLYFLPILYMAFKKLNVALVTVLLFVPMAFLDLGNFRIVFVFLGLLFIPRRTR